MVIRQIDSATDMCECAVTVAGIPQDQRDPELREGIVRIQGLGAPEFVQRSSEASRSPQQQPAFRPDFEQATVNGDCGVVGGDRVIEPPEADQEEVALLVARYDLLAVPVVDTIKRCAEINLQPVGGRCDRMRVGETSRAVVRRAIAVHRRGRIQSGQRRPFSQAFAPGCIRLQRRAHQPCFVIPSSSSSRPGAGP